MKLIFLFITGILITSCHHNSAEKDAKEDKIQSLNAIDGELLLKENCYSCHKCYGDMVGPGLHGSMQRWDSKENLIAFVQHSEPILRKSKYAVGLKKKYRSKYIHHFSNLDSNQIKTMIYYCDFY